MPKEISFPDNVRIFEAGPNCLTGSIAILLSLLSPNADPIDQDRLLKALPNTNDWSLANFMELLRREGFIDFNHETLEIRKRRDILHHTLTNALQGGAVIESTVVTTLWVKKIVKEKRDDISLGDLHSIVIYGYYQPSKKIDETWFYVADPYEGENRFLSLDDIFVCLDQSGGYAWLNAFDLCLDHADLIGKKAIGGIVSKRYQRYILRRLPNRSYQKKLGSLFRKD